VRTALYIYPWHHSSKGAKALSTLFKNEAKLIKRQESSFEGSQQKIVLNWGCSELPREVKRCRIINSSTKVRIASDKLKFFQAMSKGKNSPRIPSWTVSKKDVMNWMINKNEIVARGQLRGRGGLDITFSSEVPQETFLSNNQLWTLYIKKAEEYRVHVFDGKVIDLQRKVLRKKDDAGNDIDPKTIDFRIRNHINGFIFQKQNISPNSDVEKQALLAIDSLGIDFGAVDVIWNENSKKAYVLEINTAPGIEGSTVESYIEAIRTFIKKERMELTNNDTAM
jgi:glutathione synthase/RimK-type ligase-like ATP-grasp enzyme